MNLKILAISFFCFLLSGCLNLPKIKWFYPPDKTKCLTVIDKGSTKYIFANKVYTLAEGKYSSHYVELNMNKVTLLEHALYVCWNDSNKILISCPKAIVVKNTFETSDDIQVLTKLMEENGIPQLKPFNNKGCFFYDYESRVINPKENALIEER